MARKQGAVSRASEGARRATGDARAAGVGGKGRFSAGRKREAVLRLLGGASLEELSRELGVTGARLSQWRESFLDGGTQNLKSHVVEAVDDGDRQKLQAKVGELTMEIELLYKKVEILEGGRPLATRRSRR